ncbi:MAG TPA: T9SS type A sorting domain-containing protein, partial [Bacteroidia bacterium]|nr:T9SS type A sorting domain-containing protein [Bacteroidia bacterium]
VFKIMPDGTGYSKLLDCTGAANGRRPYGLLISDSAFLYGMTVQGGTNDLGVVFKIMPDGTGYTKLLDFAGASNGSHPYGSLVSDGTFLYGMTRDGGTNNLGVIFKIMLDGTGYSKLLDFAGSNGSDPTGSLISDGTFLYGMTSQGGTNNYGVVFKIMPDGTGYTKLLDFAGTANGRQPMGSLVSDSTYLYGMTNLGGTNNLGVIFKIMPNGTGYSKLLDFTGAANGCLPYGSLVSDGAFLYGMTAFGGVSDRGVIFKIMPDGTGYSEFFDFAYDANGNVPFGSLISDGLFLYGMTAYGGTNDAGTAFRYCLTMPTVNLVLNPDTVCINTSAYALSGGLPTGGTYSGAGVILGNFDPNAAGAGLHNIIYTYADTNNCSNSDTAQLVVDVCTANHTASANQTFSIFPNPSKGIFTLVFAGETKQSKIEIYNVLGEKVIQIVFPNGSGNLEIDLSDRPDGIYFLQIKTEQGEEFESKKLIINK